MSDFYSIIYAIEHDLSQLLGFLQLETQKEEYLRCDTMCWQILHRVTNVSRLRKGVLDVGRHPHSPTLVQALSDYAGSQCSDPRDRIFALLSLDESTDMLPDYTITAAQAYTRFAKHLIHHKMLNVLLVQLRTPSDFDDELASQLPSWVPDFRKSFLPEILHKPIEAFVSDTSNALELRIWCLDEIQQIDTKSQELRTHFRAYIHSPVNITGCSRGWVLDITLQRGDRSFEMDTGDLLCSTNLILEGDMTTTGVINLKTGEETSRPSWITEILVLRPIDEAAGAYKIVSTFESDYLSAADGMAFNRTAVLPHNCEMAVHIV